MVPERSRFWGEPREIWGALALMTPWWLIAVAGWGDHNPEQVLVGGVLALGAGLLAPLLVRVAFWIGRGSVPSGARRAARLALLLGVLTCVVVLLSADSACNGTHPCLWGD